MKKVLVTGLSGFIGSNALEFLVDKGFEIHAFSSKERENSENVTWHKVSLLEEEQVMELVEKISPSYLLHLAWDVTPQSYMQSSENYNWLVASVNLLKAFKKNGGQRVVIAGTQFETSSPAPYPASKRALLEVLKSFGLSYAWGRIFYLFGDNEHPDRLVPYFINSLIAKKNAVCLDGEQIRDFMYVKDVARAFVEILDSDVQGVVDIGLGEGIKIKDLVNKIADKLDAHDLVQIKKSENEVQSVIANISKLRDKVKFSPAFTIDQALENMVKFSIDKK